MSWFSRRQAIRAETYKVQQEIAEAKRAVENERARVKSLKRQVKMLEDTAKAIAALPEYQPAGRACPKCVGINSDDEFAAALWTGYSLQRSLTAFGIGVIWRECDRCGFERPERPLDWAEWIEGERERVAELKRRMERETTPD